MDNKMYTFVLILFGIAAFLHYLQPAQFLNLITLSQLLVDVCFCETSSFTFSIPLRVEISHFTVITPLIPTPFVPSQLQLSHFYQSPHLPHFHTYPSTPPPPSACTHAYPSPQQNMYTPDKMFLCYS